MKVTASFRLLALLGLAACSGDDDPSAERVRASTAEPAAEQGSGVVVYGGPDQRMSPEDLERGRMDPSWRRVIQLDSAAAAGDTAAFPESWDGISAQAINQSPVRLPLRGDIAGPSVLRVQILLDRALFSPGVMDGRWGKNTEKAVYWFQRREGLPATGEVDERTFERLRQVAGDPQQLVREHTLTAEEVEGPFVQLPDDIYERAELECMCYESLAEKLGELYHATPELLEKLNPGVDLASLGAGDRVHLPNVRDEGMSTPGTPTRLVVSDGGYYLHALDAQGRILYHFPTTLGSDYSPSPTGDYSVTAIAQDPTWHYQPDILEGIPDDEEDAVIPPGPNNAVGVVWMQLSKPHYGIHGTSAPETIGYTTSNGCVRLTNWDARFLSQRVEAGIPVEFRDVDNPGGATDDEG